MLLESFCTSACVRLFLFFIITVLGKLISLSVLCIQIVVFKFTKSIFRFRLMSMICCVVIPPANFSFLCLVYRPFIVSFIFQCRVIRFFTPQNPCFSCKFLEYLSIVFYKFFSFLRHYIFY